MNPFLFCSIAAVTLIGIGVYLTRRYYGPVIREAREAAEAKAAEKAEQERRGREANDRANFKMDVAGVLEDLIQNPEWLRGRSDHKHYRRGFELLREFVGRFHKQRDQDQRIKDLEDRLRRNGEIARANEKLLRDIAKALQLGQPIE